MKILVPAVSILMALLLVSCQKKEDHTKTTAAHEAQTVHTAQPQQPQPAVAVVDGFHTVVVEEVVQAPSYTYLKVKEADTVFWIAINKTDIETGETISFENPLEMRNFTSKELARTFDTIYFVSGIDQASSAADRGHITTTSHQKSAVETTAIAIDPVEGGVSIGDLFANRDTYAGKVIRMKGQVTKVNLSIMGKNWIHLQDGSGDPGSNDLLVTTQDTAAVGDVVVFEGTVVLNKDFGSGYSYELLMEEAKKQPE